MPAQDEVAEYSAQSVSNAVGFYAAITTAIATLITFGFAIIAIPISGANCPKDCIDYPYLDTVAQFPKDYRWMPLAMGLVVAYVILMVAIHASTPVQRKLFSQLGLAFGMMTAVILLIDYFVQFSVVPVSLMNAETEGIALLTQYNPHGLFIALEELGYLLMSLSFLFMAFVFTTKNRLETAVRLIFIGGFVLTVLALIAVSAVYGLDRQYRFEILVISIDWLVLLINGMLLSIIFRRQLQALQITT